VIFGVGTGGGFALLQAAKNAGARVFGVGGEGSTGTALHTAGLDHVMAPSDPVAAETRRMTEGRGADIVMEFTGHPKAFAEGLDIAPRGASYVVVGQLGQGETTIKPASIVSKNLRVLGSFSGQAKAYWKALDFVSAHIDHIPFQQMISNRYKLDEVNTAMTRMKNYEEIKPLIEL